MLKTFFLGLFVFTSAPGQNLHLKEQGHGIKHIRVLSEGGDIRVRATRGETISADGSLSLGGPGCALKAERSKPNTLIIRARDASSAPCRIDLNVSVPQEMDMHIEADEGNVFVSGLRNSLEVVLGHGNAVLGGTFPHLSAQLAQGSLSVQGLAGDAELELHQGNAQLWYGLKPRGTAQLNVEHGNVTVTAPVRALNMAATVEAGTCTNPLDNSADAALKISGRIGHGNLTVRPGASR